MEQYQPIPSVDDGDAPAFAGHLWLLEAVEGSILRFQLRESGAIRFGDERRIYRDDDEIPPECRRAVRHVRERLDREALREAVPSVSDLTFVGRATHRERIDYDWARLPPFLGLDVLAPDADPRPPDAVEGIFDQLGLRATNAVAREVHSRDFDPGSYEIPGSAWYDGPAAGVVIRDKRGGRARLENSRISGNSEEFGVSGGPEESGASGASEMPGGSEPSAESEASESSGVSEGSIDAEDADALAAAVATDRRFERVAERLRAQGREPTVDALRDRVLEDVYREEHGRLFGDGVDGRIDESAFRTAVATRAQRFLGG